MRAGARARRAGARSRGARRGRSPAPAAALALLVLAVLAAPAAALDWGGIVPGASTMEAVRASYGAPSRTSAQKVEGFDTATWIYEGPRAPAGIRRLTVEFGLKVGSDYRADLVRAFRLEPKPGAFTRRTILVGWGEPTAVKVDDRKVTRFFYQEGLVVDFDADGWTPTLLTFTPPQPPPPSTGPKP